MVGRFVRRKGKTMRKYIVRINGSVYEVEVEELSGFEAQSVERQAQAPSVQAPPVQAPPVQAPPVQAPPVSTGGKSITAPMPGSIISVNVKPGDRFKSGQVLLVLEAMKMENEIMAPHDGVAVSVNVTNGASVNSGDVLISYE